MHWSQLWFWPAQHSWPFHMWCWTILCLCHPHPPINCWDHSSYCKLTSTSQSSSSSQLFYQKQLHIYNVVHNQKHTWQTFQDCKTKNYMLENSQLILLHCFCNCVWTLSVDQWRFQLTFEHHRVNFVSKQKNLFMTSYCLLQCSPPNKNISLTYWQNTALSGGWSSPSWKTENITLDWLLVTKWFGS